METAVHILRASLDGLAYFGIVALAAFGVCGLFAFAWSMFRDVCRRCSLKFLAIALPVCIAAAIFADKRGGTQIENGEFGIENYVEETQALNSEITNLCFTAISCHTNTLEQNVVSFDLAWPSNLLYEGEVIDVFAKTNLMDEGWMWIAAAGPIGASQTNAALELLASSVGSSLGCWGEPPALFFKANARSTIVDALSDTDGDGLPDIYEWMNGTNPYVSDYSSAPRIVAGGGGADDPATLSAAFAASEPYSIIEIAPGVHEGSGWTGISFPAHPVLVTSPDGGVSRSSVLRHTGAGLWALRLESEQTHDTVVQGLVVELVGQGSIQTAFWCGGNLPFMGQPASALFRNCFVRMPKSGVADYCAWKFYRWHSNEVVIAGCAVNAAGADGAIGIQAVDGPPMSVENCSFLNFPHGDDTHKGWGLHYKATALNYGGAEWPVPVEIVNCLFDASFTNAYALAPEGSQEYGPYHVTMLNCMVPSSLTYAPDHSENLMVADYGTLWNGRLASDSPAIGAGTNALYSLRDLDGRFRPFPPSIGAFEPGAATEALDTDGDGLSDVNEMSDYGTDPYLADSDNDGVSDGGEIHDETDPTNPHSFTQTLDVTATNKVSLSHAIYVAWGYSAAGWEANELEVFPTGFGATNYINASSLGATHMKAFCDLNDNGEYDVAHDILLVRPIPYGSTAQIDFVFGDVDGDGVADAQERSDGTDPHDAKNFRLTATLDIESSDVAWGLTNYVACGLISAGWSTGENSSFVGSTLQFPVDAVATNGEVFVKVFRDFNANGIYDAGVDALVVQRLAGSDRGKTIEFPVGDSDGDRILDSVELEEGTNPLSGYDYCFNLSLTYTGVFHTTNALTFTAFLGTNLVYGPCVVEGGVWTHDFGHCVAAAGERVLVNVWDDADHNGEWDTGETSNRYTVAITSHDMVVTSSLSYGNFDRDNNMIPDWWEAQEGLAAEGVARRAYDDPDGDGLINLHEFLCDTHPLVPDGSNTLLSVASRSIDDRLLGKSATNSLCLFENYFENGTNGVFQTNANFWANDVDLSGISVWNSSNLHNERAGALISPQHLLMANHWYPSSTNEILYFRGKSGNIYSRRPVKWQGIIVPITISTFPDTGVVLLNEPLDTNDVCVVPLFSTNLLSKVGGGYAVPFLYLNRKKEALVKEVRSLTLGGNVTTWHHVSFMRPTVIGRQSFVTDVLGIQGDSSSPSFVLVRDRLVLLGIHSRTTSDSPVFLFADQIQQTMDALKSGETLLIEDVTMFPDIQFQ